MGVDPIPVDIYIYSAPDSLDDDRLKNYIDWNIKATLNLDATTSLIVSDTRDHIVRTEKPPSKPPIIPLMLDHTIPRYYCEVRFPVKTIPPPEGERDNYEKIHKLILHTFEIFCQPTITTVLKYVDAIPSIPFVPDSKKAAKVIETDIETLSRKVDIVSEQIEFLTSKL